MNIRTKSKILENSAYLANDDFCERLVDFPAENPLPCHSEPTESPLSTTVFSTPFSTPSATTPTFQPPSTPTLSQTSRSITPTASSDAIVNPDFKLREAGGTFSNHSKQVHNIVPKPEPEIHETQVQELGSRQTHSTQVTLEQRTRIDNLQSLTMIDMASSYSSQDSTVLRVFVDELFEICRDKVGIKPSMLLGGKTKTRNTTLENEKIIDAYHYKCIFKSLEPLNKVEDEITLVFFNSDLSTVENLALADLSMRVIQIDPTTGKCRYYKNAVDIELLPVKKECVFKYSHNMEA